MSGILHITSGDIAGGSLAKAGLPGEVFVWHDILYDGPREPGWPDPAILRDRARFIETFTGGGLHRDYILKTFEEQYQRLADAQTAGRIVLWFDACLFDQAMLAHVLNCLAIKRIDRAELICINAFPGIDPFHGLGQMTPDQLASVYPERRPVTRAQFSFAETVDRAFALQDPMLLEEIAEMMDAPLPEIPAAVRRWLLEQPDPDTGLGRLETLALSAIQGGCRTPGQIIASVSAVDPPPHYWGDTTLWARINGLADMTPPLIRIQGPSDRLPQWESPLPLEDFTITA